MTTVLVLTDNFERFIGTRPDGFSEKFDARHITNEKGLNGYSPDTKVVTFGKVDEDLLKLTRERFSNVMKIA